MQYGIFSVSDITRDPVSGRTPSEAERIDAIVKIATHAEEVGLDVFAIGEHHNPPFFSSSPTTLLAHIAALTERLLVTTSTTLITTNDPVRLAEEYAMLQHLSKGRMDLMLGRGNTGPVYPWFGKDIRQSLPLALENYNLLHRLWHEDVVDWEGKFRTPLQGFTSYQTSDATTLVATPGVADIVQVSSGGARWVVRTRAGDVYYNNYSNTGSRAKWTQLPGVPSASSMMAYPFDSTEYIIALGSDDRIYTSVGLVPFVQHMQGLPGGLAPKKISVEAGRWAVLDSNGDFYHTVNSSQTGVWNKVNAPVPLASYSAYEGNSAYVHAIGTDGNPYQSNGSAFFRKPGTPDGQVVDVVIGSGTWTARTSSGDVYYTNTSNAVGGASANGTYTLITGASGITLHSSYWAGNYIIGVAPTAP